MNLDSDNISLAHVHAYVDAQLNDDDCERLEGYFDTNTDKFDQLQQFLAINEHYQTMYNPVLNEPIPENMLERIYGGNLDPYGGNLDPFESPNREFPPVLTILSSILFEKPNAWKGAVDLRLYSFLRINQLEGKPWLIKLRSMVSKQARKDGDSALVKLLKSLKLHPQTAPSWLNQFRRQATVLLAKPKSSLGDVNIFAAAVIVTIGIVIGVNVSRAPGTDSAVTTNPGYVESQAIQAHLFYRKEGRSVLEANNDEQQRLLTWVSGRLGKEIRLIDFTEMGYSNAGMMLVPAMDNFAMVTVYENGQGQRLTLYVGLRDADKTDDVKCVARENTKSLCSWANDDLQFVVVSDLTVAETTQLAEWMRQNYAMAHLISSNEYFFSQTLGTINA